MRQVVFADEIGLPLTVEHTSDSYNGRYQNPHQNPERGYAPPLQLISFAILIIMVILFFW